MRDWRGADQDRRKLLLEGVYKRQQQQPLIRRG